MAAEQGQLFRAGCEQASAHECSGTPSMDSTTIHDLRCRHVRARQAPHHELGRGAAQHLSRAEEPDRPALRAAARRPARPARPDVKARWDGMRCRVRGAPAVCWSETGCGPEHVLQPTCYNRDASSRVAPHCCSLAGPLVHPMGSMRRFLTACPGRKRPPLCLLCVREERDPWRNHSNVSLIAR